MKSIIFDNVEIKNFLSIGNDPVIVNFKTGLNIITGINLDQEDRRNGIGKSAILDSVYFCLYGEALREVERLEQLNNYRTKKSCAVKLKFHIVENTKITNVEICRYLKPSKCEIFIDNELKTLDSITNTNALIVQLLHCDKDAFKNCVSMSLNNTTPFMLKKKQQKREFIESIFNLGTFSEMLDIVKKRISTDNRELEVEAAKFDETGRNITAFENQKKNFESEKIRKKQNFNVRIEQIDKEISQNNKAISELKEIDFDTKYKELNTRKTEIQKGINGYRNKAESVSSLIVESTTKIIIFKKNLESISKQLGSCPTCKRPFLDHDKELLEKEKISLQENIDSEKSKSSGKLKEKDEYLSAIRQLEEAIDTIDSQIKAFDRSKSQIRLLDEKNNSLEKEKEQVNQNIIEIDNSTAQFDKFIEDNKNRQKELTTIIEKKKDNLALLDKAKFVFSEEGVKAYLIKKTLDLFNNRLAYYLKQLNSKYMCLFNEYFEEEILNDLGETYSYNNLSGAERKSIDFACLFTFMDVRRLQGDVSINVSFYDELLDTSLDEKGIELVLNILKERIEKYNESMFVISHRKEAAKFATGEVIFIELRSGISKRVEYSNI